MNVVGKWDEPFLTVEDLAGVLRVSREQVLAWRREHGWPSVVIGRRIFFTSEQVAQIVARHTVAPDVGEERPGLVLVDGQTTRSASRQRRSVVT